MINAEDRRVPEAVNAVLPEVARAVDYAAEALRTGHRVHYVGAGTSGRLATLDAAELVPTFNVPKDWFVPHHAGGERALRHAVENAEDDAKAGDVEMTSTVEPGDFVLGLTASGRTPFVLGGLAAASRRGARTALVSGDPAARHPQGVDVLIAVGRGRTDRRRHRRGSDRRLDQDEGRYRAEDDPHRVLDSDDDQDGPDVLEPDGQYARHEREVARADGTHSV
jgi:N-acetylmuramic acid 6-phosphate (MurNAc-6-P) etherase